MSVLSTLIVLDGSVDETLVQASLPPGVEVRVARLTQGVEPVLSALDQLDADLVVVGATGESEGSLEVIRYARRRDHECAIVALHAGNPNGYLERAFAAGVDDLIVLPQGRDALAFALEKALTRRRGASAEPKALGEMICIVGPKGGTGKTLTACNLGVALAHAGRSAAIVDLDLQFGDVGIALGVTPERTIYDLAVSGGALDAEKVERFLTPHPSGAQILLAPTRPDQAGAADIDFLRRLFPVLRSRHDFVIVDTPPAFTPEVIASIDSATTLLVVGMLDALSLKDTKIGLETLALMGYDLRAVRIVLNRADTSVGISADDVRTILGRKPDVLVPSDRAVPRAITDGLAIVDADAKSGPARAFSKLAQLYLDDGAAETEPIADVAAPTRHRGRLLLRKGY